MRDECADYGTVEGVCIPVPPKTMPPDEPGRAYIMFASHEEANNAKPVFDGRLFDEVKVTAKLMPDEDFQKAAAGEWIHIPLPGGLPAHPGRFIHSKFKLRAVHTRTSLLSRQRNCGRPLHTDCIGAPE